MSSYPHAEKARKTTLRKEFELKLKRGESAFPVQMAFNAYDMEQVSNGVLVRFAYLHQGTATEIVPILVSTEAIELLRKSAERYIQEFGTPPVRTAPLPVVRQCSPLFSNNVQLSKSGTTGEIGFYTVLLQDIANISLGRVSPDSTLTMVSVGLFHSDVNIHAQLIVELLSLQT